MTGAPALVDDRYAESATRKRDCDRSIQHPAPIVRLQQLPRVERVSTFRVNLPDFLIKIRLLADFRFGQVNVHLDTPFAGAFPNPPGPGGTSVSGSSNSAGGGTRFTRI